MLYKDASQNIDTRVDDLLSRMTLEEKVAQLVTVWHGRREFEDDEGRFLEARAKAYLAEGIGQIARPSELKKPTTVNKTPQQSQDFVNASQKWLVENTRLGIPAIYHEEALHGLAALYATSFPQAIALASSWDPALIREIYDISAKEIRAFGGTQALTPILDVARDPRWGRIEETLGEDPYLAAALGVEGVKGFQGEGPAIDENHVIATLKHLAGHGEPSGGLNTAPTPVGERTLREIFLFPFEAAVKLAGARSVMASYNEIDGIPSHANAQLLNDILRDEWGFDGTVVSDYFAIAQLVSYHRLAETNKEAALMALEAGVDLEMPDSDAFDHLPALVEEGKLDISVIDTAVARVLREKFLLGLFENPYIHTQDPDAFVGNDEHIAVALKAAEKSVVLLKNDNKLLPINAKSLKSMALIGPHIDETLLGGYSDVPRKTVSILEGLKNYLGDAVAIHTEKGTLLTIDHWEKGEDSIAVNSFSKERWTYDEVVPATSSDTQGMIEKAVKAAQKSDVAVVVVGDNEATSREGWAENHLGDRASLRLFGEQEALVNAVLETGTPTVVVLINGRPCDITSLAERAPAIIEGWYLGQETGNALANVLFGDVNPGGKLPVSIPRSVGHIPAYYNHKPAAKRGYAFDQTNALYPFGHGLSYTEFEYSDLAIGQAPISAGGSVEIGITVRNVGEREGDEIVQLYINDIIASLTRPVKELKGFQRISLAAGEARRITFTLYANQLGFYDQKMRYCLEPGDIKVMIGSSSADIRAEGQFAIVGEKKDITDEKIFLSQVRVAEES